MINLLPPQFKKGIKKEANWRMFVILGLIFLFFLLSLFLILLSVKVYVSGQAESQEISLKTERDQFSDIGMKQLEDEIRVINQEMFQLQAFYKEQFLFSDFLENLAEALPAASYFTRVSFRYLSQEEGIRVNLSGFASNREALRQFRNNLEDNPDVYDVELPGINPDNFSMTFKIKI